MCFEVCSVDLKGWLSGDWWGSVLLMADGAGSYGALILGLGVG